MPLYDNVSGVPRNGPSWMGQKKESITFVILSFAWCHQESNRGHKDFQSFALPTELWHLAFLCECKGIANFLTVQIFLIKFLRIVGKKMIKKAASRWETAFSLVLGDFIFSKSLWLSSRFHQKRRARCIRLQDFLRCRLCCRCRSEPQRHQPH